MGKITYTKQQNALRYSTTQFIGGTATTGEVWESVDGLWNGWVITHSAKPNLKELGFTSKVSATAWVNRHLRAAGVR